MKPRQASTICAHISLGALEIVEIVVGQQVLYLWDGVVGIV